MSSASAPLKRVVGLPGAVLLGLGSILGTGVFVSIGLAAGIAGDGIVWALSFAAALALVNGLSSAQLAAAFPVAGGTYEYGYRTLGPWWGRAAGWTFLLAKSASMATAARGFGAYLVQGVPFFDWLSVDVAAVASVVVVTFLTVGGLKRSSTVNALLVAWTLAALATFIVICARTSPPIADAPLVPIDRLAVAKATAFLFVAYTGYGRIATLGEEVRDPARTIPRAVVMTLALTACLYLAVAIAALHAVGADGFAAAAGKTGPSLARIVIEMYHPFVGLFIALGAVAAMVGVQLNLSLGLSRVVLAMARRRDLPAALETVANATPRRAVIAVGVVAITLVVLFDIRSSWTFSAGTVLVYYAITNLAATRLAPAQRRLPGAVAWLGLIACAALAVVSIWLW